MTATIFYALVAWVVGGFAVIGALHHIDSWPWGGRHSAWCYWGCMAAAGPLSWWVFFLLRIDAMSKP